MYDKHKMHKKYEMPNSLMPDRFNGNTNNRS
jgi:hypothetical protein